MTLQHIINVFCCCEGQDCGPKKPEEQGTFRIAEQILSVSSVFFLGVITKPFEESPSMTETASSQLITRLPLPLPAPCSRRSQHWHDVH